MPLLPAAASSDDLLLLCAEDAAAFADDPPPVALPDLTGLQGEDDEEAIAAAAVDDLTAGYDFSPLSAHRSPRRRSVDWVLKVCSYYSFQPLTAYLAVSYLDQFLSCHSLPEQSTGWPMQLLSVACLSLAAKLEETHVPALLDLQVDDAAFVFDPQTICRMELLVLTALDWRLRFPTPFSFLNFFARKADAQCTTFKLLTLRASMVILEFIRDIEFLEYHPSTIAASALVFASGEIPNQSFIGPGIAGSWCRGLVTDEITKCYESMCKSAFNCNQQRIKPRIQHSTSTTRSPSSHKRRKLNNCRHVEDDNVKT